MERQIVGVSYGNLSGGRPQPWPSKPWEPGMRAGGKNLYICVVSLGWTESDRTAAIVIPVCSD